MELMFAYVRVLTMEAELPVIGEGFVGIREGRYAFAAAVQPRIMARRFVDGRGKTLVPLSALPVLQALLDAGDHGITGEAPADCALLDGSWSAWQLEQVPLSAICMIVRDGVVRWEKACGA